MSHPTLIDRLEYFIKKYYQNQLLKGVILGLSILIIAFFSLSFAEYMGRFEPVIRTLLFYSLIVFAAIIFTIYILPPLLGLFQIRRKFGYNEAADLIGRHFPQVQDKLINTLQLQSSIQNNDSLLLLASINQRIEQLSPIPFVRAIPFHKNKVYLKYALLPAFVLLSILIVIPGFKESTERLVHYQTHFMEQAPFEFNSSIGDLKYIQGQDIPIPLSITGNEIPSEVYIHIGNYTYKMRTNALGSYIYQLKNIQKSESIYFEAGGYRSKTYPLTMLLKPRMMNSFATLIYPPYLDIPTKTVENMSELKVPQGTTISWEIKTQNVSKLHIDPLGKIYIPKKNKTDFKIQCMESSQLKIRTENKDLSLGDSMSYLIQVIPDIYPTIHVKQQKDSISQKIIYFIGEIGDDHGFTRLYFNYKLRKYGEKDSLISLRKSIPIPSTPTSQGFYFYWNIDTLQVGPNDELTYYFTVWDNDGVNGNKSAQTPKTTFRIPSMEEIAQQTEQLSSEIKATLNQAQSDSKELEKEMNSIEKMLTEKKNLDWNDQQKIKEMLDKKQAILDQIKKTIEKNKEKNVKENEFNPIEEELLEKQKKLGKIMEEVLDEKTKALLDKIKQLMEENKKDELQNALQDLKFDETQMNKEMDRLLELYKELELEKKRNETINKINDLAKKQKELAQKTKDKKEPNIAPDQQKLKQSYKDVKKDLEDIREKNQALENPMDIDDHRKEEESIDQKMQDALSKEQKGKSKDASQDMDDAAQQLQELAEKMQQEMDEDTEDKQGENYQTLRQILENLIQLSFDQESLMEDFKKNQRYSPEYVVLRQKQQRIKSDTKMVEDSLFALSKRNEQIQSFVNEEIARVNDNLDQSLKYLGERSTNNALVTQQYAMSGYNNLALMLSESLKQMQAQMKAQKQKKGKPKGECKKPGSGEKGDKPQQSNANAIKKLQDELARQMKALEEGQKQGKGKPTSKEFAEMAAKQAAIRKKVQDLHRKLQKEGKGSSLGDLKKTQDLMDQVEEDLYNKRLNSQTFQKLKQIEFKLSEHEKAEKEQEQDQSRTSNEGQDIERSMPDNIKKYLEQKEREIEMLKRVSPELQPYYKEKVEHYFAQ